MTGRTIKASKASNTTCSSTRSIHHAVIFQKHDSSDAGLCLSAEQRLLPASLCDGHNYQHHPSLHLLFSFHLLQDWKTAREVTGAEVEFTPAPDTVFSGCHLKRAVEILTSHPPRQGYNLSNTVAGTSREGD